MTALTALLATPRLALAPESTPVLPMRRLAAALGPACPTLLIKRDDLLSFGAGGNKVRKMQTVLAQAQAEGADTLITCGGVQSNHARVTAAAGAAFGMPVHLVANGQAPAVLTGNARLNALFGATVHYVDTREARALRMAALADELRAAGRRPFVIPLGASTVTGALGFAQGITELSAANVRPHLIVHATSSGGTQAGLLAGCGLFGLKTRILGVSADDPESTLRDTISHLLDGISAHLGARRSTIDAGAAIEVDAGFVGDGYGVPTPASLEAAALAARHEGIVLDQTYTAKAMAGLIARIRAGAIGPGETVLFWHTGGVPGFFA